MSHVEGLNSHDILIRKDEKERFYEEAIVLYEELQKRKYSGTII